MKNDSSVLCWGYNSDGQVGNGLTSGAEYEPVVVADFIPSPTPSPTSTNTPTSAATVTATSTVTPTVTNTATATPTATTTSTPTQTSSPTATSMATPSATATSTASPTVTPVPSNTATSAPTATATSTPTAISTNTPALTATPTVSPTATSTPVLVQQDLAVGKFDISANAVRLSKQLAFEVRIASRRSRTAKPFTLEIYLSKDKNFDAISDVLLTAKKIRSLKADESINIRLSKKIPTNTIPGNYWLFAFANNGDLIRERNEKNNIKRSSRSLRVQASRR